jgi:hypothetical protein
MNASSVAPRYEETKQQTDKRLDLIRRFTLSGFAKPATFEHVPHDATLFLLPDDVESFVERELKIDLEAARQGENAFFRHVHDADIPR